MRTLVLTVLLPSLIPFSLYASARSDSGGLPERVAELEAQVAAMEEILQFVHVEPEEINGLAGPHWIIEGANVHVRSGSGTTRDACDPRDPNFPNCESLSGLGNLIVGYNEPRPPRHPGAPPDAVRTGSHNLVVGDWHSYASYAGFVAGMRNRLVGPHSSVSGGFTNRASGWYSSICGGIFNEATGDFSSVSGGRGNVASGSISSVSGGEGRVAPDESSWAAGSLFEEN